MVPVELIIIGVIIVVFSVIFAFLHLELSTRKKRLVQKVETRLKDLPSKLSEKSKDGDTVADAVHEFFHTKGTDKDFKSLGEKLGFYSDTSVQTEAGILMKKITKLSYLSIGELESIQTMVEDYHSKIPENWGIKRVLSRINQMLEPFIATRHESKDSGKSEGTGEGKPGDKGEGRQEDKGAFKPRYAELGAGG